MKDIGALVEEQMRLLPGKPDNSAPQSDKKRYSELMSAAAARALAEALRQRGLKGTLPDFHAEGKQGNSEGAERRMDGGLGAKKVDVTWATEESGLLLALSIKTINFKDGKTGNFQKNLTNRRNDMLFESTTLHRRFPYAVLGGFFFLDAEANRDGTGKRHSTFVNAHRRMKMFTGRADPAGRPEQYERIFIVLVRASAEEVTMSTYRAGEPETAIDLSQALLELIGIVAERSPDFYDLFNGVLVKTG